MAGKHDKKTQSAPSVGDIAQAAERIGCELTDEQAAITLEYLKLLKVWAKKMNLVGAKDWRGMIDLFIDSWKLADFLESLDIPESPLTLDLGAGAGLPGVPLRAVWQKGTYHLVEIREKRTIFLNVALSRLQLPRTEVVRERAENLEAPHIPADIILSRAFMPWEKLLPFVRPLLTQTGTVVMLSNDPPPDKVPDGWKRVGSSRYEARGETDYFWAFTPDMASR